jgi:hypothetical protein
MDKSDGQLAPLGVLHPALVAASVQTGSTHRSIVICPSVPTIKNGNTPGWRRELGEGENVKAPPAGI